MTGNNHILCTVEFLHEYYTNGKCPDLEIMPASATAGIMKGQWLSLHPLENGFRVAYVPEKLTDPQDSTFTYEKLRFLLRVKDPGFFYYTAIDWQENALFYYSFDQTGQLETNQVKLFGRLFNYGFSVAQIAPVTLRITNASGVQVYEKSYNITETDNNLQIDLRNRSGGQYNILLLQNEVLVHEEKCVIDDELPGKNIFGILEIPELSPAGPAPLFQVAFNSSQSTWKYYIITQEEDPLYIYIPEDKENTQSNRYSGIDFEFAERPVDRVLNGQRIFLFETGTINGQNEFVPQLIPAFEESKKGLYLNKYEFDPNPGGGNPDFYEKLVKDELWDSEEKKHMIPPGEDIYEQIGLLITGYTAIKNLQNPSMNKRKKEVFIYL